MTYEQAIEIVGKHAMTNPQYWAREADNWSRAAVHHAGLADLDDGVILAEVVLFVSYAAAYLVLLDARQ